MKKAFSLIELMIVIVILGLIASLVVPNIISQGESAKKKLVCVQMKNLKNALDSFKVEEGTYPTTQEGLKALIQNPNPQKYTNYPKDGFLSGGDDYITKPFDNDELLLRIEAILRRTKKIISVNVGSLSHDEEHKRILYNDIELDISVKEYQLLLLLMLHCNSTVSKELITQELWSASQSNSDGAIRVYINRIKQLLPMINIENIRGVGYKLVS
jgi:type II secretion system protein G